MRNQARERILLQLWKDACLELSIICTVYLNEKKNNFQFVRQYINKGHLKN